MEQQKQRVIVYIDGFNFYFGLKHNAKWKKYYWLDVVKLFESFMRPNQELVVVKFTIGRLFVRFVGTHSEYDKIDCSNI